ncbi:dihydrofolate reductase family protein [Demetria terragena]|uniref:dihydrofolate reductase family protein n=1 Tax=Demetria terragena TaxID=63959 RepID=UPI000380ECC6|nr:dihydrofolate reductase family protein [Demetria terragena]
MRVLINDTVEVPPSADPDAMVQAVYGSNGPLVRWNMVSTLDGSAVGADGGSGSINNAADFRVFGFLRGWADVVVVGAGTARAEGYRPLRPNRWSALREGRSDAPLLAVVSRRAELPDTLQGQPKERVLLLHGAKLGGRDIVNTLRTLGHQRILFEGGPRLAAQFLDAGIIDELCLTIVPTLVGGDGTRITQGPGVDQGAQLASLLEEDGTLLSRWRL